MSLFSWEVFRLWSELPCVQQSSWEALRLLGLQRSREAGDLPLQEAQVRKEVEFGGKGVWGEYSVKWQDFFSGHVVGECQNCSMLLLGCCVFSWDFLQ